ncbi:MAG: DctP family TRAP transporter solute-binding subunit [Alphaproteobacteria bacterium]|nr:DctP family TRAP transporter solute-binding subunit [Alphaproteobacteria bacterium]
MKIITKSFVLGAMLLSSTTALANCDEGELVIKFSHVVNVDKHPKGIAANLFMERVNEEMDGKVCMQVFPNSTLFNDNQVLEGILNGAVQMAAPGLSKFESFTKKFRIFDLPFMFKNIDAVDKFQNSEQGDELKASMERRGLIGLQFWHNGMKQISANVPLTLPTDAAGLKFRVINSEVIVSNIKSLGAYPQPMAFSEVYGALQAGVVDGQENTWSNIYGRKFFEVQHSITETNHGLVDYLVLTNVDWWNSLDAEIRGQLSTILEEVTILRNKESFKVNETAKQLILQRGGIVKQLDDEQRQAWVDAMKPVWSQYEDEVGKDTIEAIQAINEAL